MEDLSTLLQQAGNAAPLAPAGNPEGTGGAAAEGAGSPPAGQPESDNLPGSIKEYLAKNPDHKSAVDLVTAEMQKGFTPKLMEAAELRKKLEGLDDEFLRSARDLRRLSQENPAGAAQWLRQYADTIAPVQPSQPAGPEFQPLTESEGILHRQIQEMRAELQQAQAGFHQMTLQQQAVQVNDQFNQIQKELGVEIPSHERRNYWQASLNVGGAISPADIYFAKNRETIGARIAQKARDDAAATLVDKANGAGGNPAGVTPRTGGASDDTPKDFATIFRRELEARGG